MADPAQAPLAESAASWRDARAIGFALLLALPFLWNLGGTPLFDVDEGAFSEATREMLASGDWGHTTLNGAPRFDKPILVYWLQAAAAGLFGAHEFAFRLPSALSCWLLALALAHFAQRRWGEPAGLFAGVIAATSLGLQAIGRGATADGLLNLLLVLAGLDLWRFLASGERAPLRRAYAWVGLGLLAKGPVAVLVPGAAFVLWCLVQRRGATLRSALADLRGWALLLVIALPWYLYALDRHGMAFVEGFFLRHNVERFTGTIGGHRGSLLYYVAVLPLLAMPWAPLLALVVARVRTLWREPLARYLLLWAGFVLAFFSLSGTKLPHYVLYGYPPLVLLMARLLAQASPRLLRLVAAGLLLWTLAVLAAPWLVLHFAPSVRDPMYRALLSGAPAPQWLPSACAFAVIAALLAWALRARGALPHAMAAGVLALFVAGWTLPWFGEALQGPVRRAAGVAAARPETAVQWQLHNPSFAVYLQRVAPHRAPLPGELALTRIDRLPAGDDGRARLWQERGLVLLGPRR